MSGVFPYPGDDPASLSSLASTLSTEASNVNTAMTELKQGSSSMKANWQAQAADAAAADLTRMDTALSTAKTHFTEASTAVTTYRSSLVSIRTQVDDLRRQYQTQNQALQTEGTQLRQADRLGEANNMSDAQLQQYKNTLTSRETATKGKMDHLQDEYNALVKKANTATTTCKTALQNSITGYAYAGSTPVTVGLDDALGVSNFGLLHTFQVQQAAHQAAKIAHQLANPPDPEDPHYREKVAALLKLTNQYYGDPTFSTTFYQDLGQKDALKLPLQLGYHDGGLDPQAIGQLQKNLGADFAAATQFYGNAAGNKNHVPQLDDGWVKTLIKDGDQQVFGVKSSNNYEANIPLFGHQGLGILMHTGQYSASFLDQEGNAIKNFESNYDSSYGSNPWKVGGEQGDVLWFGGNHDASDDNGLDPMSGWSQAGLHNPPAERAALVHDNGLLNYMLNDRDWSASTAFPGEGDPNAVADIEGKYHHGLSLFGQSLNKATGVGAVDPQSRQLFENVVNDLGDDKLNHRIDSDHFKDGNWIPPELRPSLGGMTVKNIDIVHSSLAQEPGAEFDDGGDGHGLRNLSRFIADEGKDPTARVDIAHAEDSWARTALTHGLHDPSQYSPDNDMRGLAKTYGLLDYGGNAHTDSTTAAADAEYNGTVDEISSYATEGLKEAAGKIPLVGDVASFGIDKLSDAITGSLHVDHSQEAYVKDANEDFGSQGHIVDIVNNARLNAVDPSALSTANPDLFPKGQPIPDYNHLSGPQQQALDNYYSQHKFPTVNDLPGKVRDDWITEYAGDVGALIR